MRRIRVDHQFVLFIKSSSYEFEEEEIIADLSRLESQALQFKGVSGYMLLEVQSTEVTTEKSDIYSFGVVILELLFGEEL